MSAPRSWQSLLCCFMVRLCSQTWHQFGLCPDVRQYTVSMSYQLDGQHPGESLSNRTQSRHSKACELRLMAVCILRVEPLPRLLYCPDLSLIPSVREQGLLGHVSGAQFGCLRVPGVQFAMSWHNCPPIWRGRFRRGSYAHRVGKWATCGRQHFRVG